MKKLFVILTAIAMVGAFTATAMAADWGFYGSARMETAWMSQDEDLTGTGDSQTIFANDLMGTSRIGANVKVSDAVSGRFEYGGTNNLRLLYGTYTWGSGTLLVGQTYTPGGSMTNGNQSLAGDYGMYTFGLYESRKPQVTLKFGGFSFGVVQNSKTVKPTDGPNQPINTWETMYPKLELGWGGGAGPMSIWAGGGYQSMKDIATDEDISSYGAGVSLGGAFGLFNFTAQGSYSSNGADASYYGHGSYETDATGSIKDTTAMGLSLSLGFTLSESFYIEGGVGSMTRDNDTYVEPDSEMTYYLNCKINMAPGVFVVPEVSVFDYMKDSLDADEGTATLIGAKWQINF
jgi:hypothetical protein